MLIRTAVEIEALAKHLYEINGGVMKPITDTCGEKAGGLVMARYAEELKEPGEIALWEKILEREGETFVTSGRGGGIGSNRLKVYKIC